MGFKAVFNELGLPMTQYAPPTAPKHFLLETWFWLFRPRRITSKVSQTTQPIHFGDRGFASPVLDFRTNSPLVHNAIALNQAKIVDLLAIA